MTRVYNARCGRANSSYGGGSPTLRRCATRPVARAIERSVWLPLGVILILALLAVLFFFVPLTLGPFKTPHLLSLLLVICAVLVASSLPKKLSAYRAVQQRERTLKETTYAISDQRILVIVRTRQGVNSYSFTRDEVGRIERFEGRDGWGDVVFGPIRAPQGSRRFAGSSRPTTRRHSQCPPGRVAPVEDVQGGRAACDQLGEPGRTGGNSYGSVPTAERVRSCTGPAPPGSEVQHEATSENSRRVV